MSEEIVAASKERISDLLQPVNGGVGEDISYDDKFEGIKQEVEKISSLTGETPNWSDVAEAAEQLLQDKSKDFRVACYLATCKCRQGTLESVLDAIILLKETTAAFWEDMFPPLRRIRARAGMVGWWSDQSGATIQDIKLAAKDNGIVAAIDAESNALDLHFREIFADHYTGMSALRDGVRHLVRTCPKEKPKEEPKPAAAPAAPGAVAPPRPVSIAPAAGGIAIGDINNIDQAEQALEPCGQAMVRVARSFRSIKPEHNMAYRLARMGTWLEFTDAPPAEDGQTLVPPPPDSLRQRFDSLVGASDYLTLLNEAEDAACDFPCWLDPHRYVATAMSAMGALFMKAKKELLLNVALFLRRLPSMQKLQFNDGTGFADGQTVMWIEQEVAGVLGAGDGGGGSGGGDGASMLDEPLKEARELAVKGELGKALGVVAGAAAGAPTPREKFRGKLAMAQLCLGAGQYSIARGQLEGLTSQIDEHNLTVWDPTLCSDVYGALYASIKSMNDALRPKGDEVAAAILDDDTPAVPPEEEAAELAAFQHLCRLDPATALKLSGG